MKKPLAYGLLFSIFFTSCFKRYIEPDYHPYEVRLFAVIRKNDRNIIPSYSSVYGIGTDSLIGQVSSWWLGPWAGSGIPPLITDTFAFPLVLDANRDSAMYCFVAKDNSRDTIGLAYGRKFSVYLKGGYWYEPESVKISFLSSRFRGDSCKVMPYNNSSIYTYNSFVEVNLRLMLKP
jgi:hypothetical protein